MNFVQKEEEKGRYSVTFKPALGSRRSLQEEGNEDGGGGDDHNDHDDAAASSSSRQSVSSYHIETSVASSIRDVSGELSLSRPSITATLTPKPRKSNDLSGLTIDKLNYASLGLHGREMELQRLNEIWERFLASDSRKGSGDDDDGGGAHHHHHHPEKERQLILLSGYSGTGKTTLVTTAFQRVTEQRGGLFVRGKFDLNLRKQPYSGIISACAEICGAILQLQIQNPTLSQQLCNHIKTELGSELALLLQVIPILVEVIEDDDNDKKEEGHHNDGSTTATSASIPNGQEDEISTNQNYPVGSNSNGGGMSSAGCKNQFNFAFLRFIRTISYQFTPLVLVLDDLQWADGASLDLLDVLLTDSITSKLLIVGIYRSNEVDETHIFHRTMDDLTIKSSKDKYFEMTHLEIGNLGLDVVHTIIQELLGIDNDTTRTMGLATICHNKTHGNVFFLLQFISMLKERQLLQFNFGTLSWMWDIQVIESCTSASDNVVDLLKAKMELLPKTLIDILTLASCLGSTFDIGILNMVWEQSTELTIKDDNKNNGDTNTLTASLERLEIEGYIGKGKANSLHTSYVWSHDKIQEAALSLVPEIERGAYSAKIGRILLSHLDEKDLDSTIFIVVNLLNGGEDTFPKDGMARLDLARLNYKASRKAISFSAFESAAAYATRGIQLLPPNAWMEYYELTLNLYTIGAQAEGFIGNTETMLRYCKQVVSQEDRPVEDKLGVYNTWIDSAINRGLLLEASNLSLEILTKFKCRFPKKDSPFVGIGVVRNVLRVKATIKSRDSSKLSEMNDATRIGLMKLLDRLTTVFYQAKDSRMPLVIFKSLNWTMRYGYCEYGSVAFAGTGMILTGILNDLQGGSKYGEQALSLVERSKSQTTAARTTFLVYGFLFSWTKPARSLLKPLLRGYDIGLQTGDTESAIWCIFQWLVIKIMIGSSLETLEADSLLYFKQMKALKRDQTVCVTKCMRQSFLNLLGHDNIDDPTNFSGDSLTEDELERFRENPFFGPAVYFYHGTLLTAFGEHVRYADLVLQMGHDQLQKANVAQPINMRDTLFKGISCFAAARETGQNKYAKMGQIFRSKIQKWLTMGNPNVKHYETLLHAEAMAVKGDKKMATIKLYETAIILAARGGYQHDAALFTERLGEFQWTVMGDREEAIYQIRQSLHYWGEWGAMAKVRHLQEKYKDIMPQPTEIAISIPPV